MLHCGTLPLRRIAAILVLLAIYAVLTVALVYFFKLSSYGAIGKVAPFSPSLRNSTETQKAGGVKTRLIYNRVGKCGSRYIITLMHQLAVRNKFKVLDYTNDRVINPRKRKLSVVEQAKFVKYITQDLQSPFVFHGHFHYIDFTRFASADPVYINLIRDPLERFKSAYYYRRFGDGRNRTWKFDGTEMEKNMTLDECVLKDYPECTNLNRLIYIMPYFCGQPKGCRGYTSKTLQQAVVNVDKYLVVGVLEDVHSFIKALEKLLPNLFNGAYELSKMTDSSSKKSTKTRRKTALSRKAAKILMRRLHLEYRFYRYVKLKFNKLKKSLQI